MTQLAERTADATTLPSDLSSPRAKLVYLYLDAAGSGSVDDLHESLDLKLISLLPVLRSLEGNGLVERDGRRYRVA